MLYVDLNLDGIKPLFSSLTKTEISKIMKRAIKHATTKARSKSVDISSQIYNLKKKDLRSKIWARFNLGSNEAPASKIEFQFKSIGLEKFSPRERADGVTAKIMRKESAVSLKKAFIAQGKRGKLVFVRKNAITSSTEEYVRKVPPGGMRRGPKGSQLPIIKLQTKGLSEVMLPHAPAIVEVAGNEGTKEMQRQLNLVLGR
jgi:hypothetical protein